MGATLDVISHGRLDFGIGAGWYEEECLANGILFPRPLERIRRLDEAIRIIKKLWTKDNVSFTGRYYTLKNATLNPKPIQNPHPPIWTGIMYGGSRMLKVIAEHADVWTISSLYLPQPTELQRIRRALEDNCREIGRNPDSLQAGVGVGCIVAEDESRVREKKQKFPPTSISVKNYTAQQMRLEGSPDQCVERLRMYSEAGVTRFVMNFPDITTIDPVRLFGERVIPAFR
jgi:alkanesulfonate monooxygenase SsuD/methylene tetrahydromethanopterin reductase-like flavin-dependent oxidoreductase (luciferase family)